MKFGKMNVNVLQNSQVLFCLRLFQSSKKSQKPQLERDFVNQCFLAFYIPVDYDLEWFSGCIGDLSNCRIKFCMMKLGWYQGSWAVFLMTVIATALPHYLVIIPIAKGWCLKLGCTHPSDKFWYNKNYFGDARSLA